MAEQEFDITEEEGEFSAFPETTSVSFSSEMKEYLTSVHSLRTGTPLDKARQDIETFGDALFVGKSRIAASALVQDEARAKMDAAVQAGSLENVREAEVQRVVEQEVVENSRSPEILAETQTNPGDIWEKVASRTAARDSAIIKKLAASTEEAGKDGILGWVLDFADIMVSFPFDVLDGGGFKRADLAKRVQTLRSANISEETFNNELDAALEEAADAGVLSDMNGLMLFGQIENIKQGGIGSEARLDKTFTLLDALSIPSALTLSAKLAVKGLNGARDTTGVLAALRGPNAGAENLKAALAKPGSDQANAAGVPTHTLPGFLRHPTSGFDPQAWSAPGFEAAAKHERSNLYLNIIRGYGFSRRINPQVFDEWLPTGEKILEQELNATSRSNVLSMRVDPDNSGNIFGSILFGRKDGLPFATKGNATQFANKHGGEIVPLVQGDKTSYVVEKVSNIPTKDLVAPITSDEIGNHFFGEFGSTFLTIPRRLEQVAKRGEGVIGRIGKDIAPLVRAAIKGTNKDERRVVENIFWELRDGDRLSKTRKALTPAEFRSEYTLMNKGVGPSKAAEGLYNTVQELNDALYFLKADVRFKDVVDSGGQVFKLRGIDADKVPTERNLIVIPAKDDLDPTTIVYNPVTGVRKEAGDLRPNQTVFEVPDGLKVGDEVATHVTQDNPELRRVYHSDVLGYNPGGPRGYEFINYGVGQRSKINIMGRAGEVEGREKILMGTATRAEAELAATQINSIFNKLNEMVPGLGGRSQANAVDSLRGLGNDPELLEVVLRNNDWNTDVGSVTDFIKVVEDYKLDPRQQMGFKHMDDAFAVADKTTGKFAFGTRAGEKMRDAFDATFNPPSNGPRGNDPLVGMGGTQAPTISPLDMIQRDFVRVTHERAFSAYNFQAVSGWLKGAKNHIKNFGDIQSLPPRQQMDAALFADNPDAAARGYMKARDAINRTLGHVSGYEKRWNGMIDRLAEKVYDKGFGFAEDASGRKVKGRILSAATAQKAKNPLTALRGFAFHAKLGVFAMDQMFVQSSQIFNILAISPLNAVPGMAAYWPLRMTMLNTSREFALEVGRRVSPFIGMDAEEFADFSRFFNESGRGIIGGEVGELNAVSHTLAKGFYKRAENASKAIFDEGERVPRGVGMYVAWKEYRKAFPKLDPFQDHGINWITGRQDALNAAMTRVSAAPWQKGPLSVPLQFMSYTSKMMESLFSNRLLTGAERGRLAAAQMTFWGASGTIIGGPIVDWAMTEGGLELSPGEATALRYGVLDWAIGATTGVDTGFGERLSVGEGIWNMWEDYNEEGLFEALGGPSVQVAGDVIDGILTALGAVTTGNTVMLGSDLTKLMRNLTGPNKLYTAWVIYNTGDYITRNGTTVARGLQNTDALLHIIGAPLQEVSLTYTRLDAFKDEDAHIRTHGMRIAEMARAARQAIKDGDLEKAEELSKQMSLMVSQLPVWAQSKMTKFYEPDAEGLLVDTIIEARRRNMPNLDIHDDREGE